MRFYSLAGIIIGTFAATSAQAFEIKILEPIVFANIDKTTQRVDVFVSGEWQYSWPVSTGTRSYSTPVGEYLPYRMHTMWYSRKYNYTPMPHAIFFKGGYAVHGTNAVWRLGRPASHGCVRLNKKHAAILFKLVRKYGKHRTRIAVNGEWQWKPAKSARKPARVASVRFRQRPSRPGLSRPQRSKRGFRGRLARPEVKPARFFLFN